MDQGLTRAARQSRDATVRRAHRNYRHYAGVVGVSSGSKFSDGRRLDDVRAVQFFVREKLPLSEIARPLPGFVYARHPDGSIDRDRRLPTDVIELRDLQACCGAGSRIERVGARGTITLMFKDKVSPGGETWGLTCAHVVGDLSQPPPANTMLVGGADQCLFIADAQGASIMSDGRLPFDIALVKVRDPVPTFDDCSVLGVAAPITRISDRERISVLDQFSCAFGVTGTGTAVVESIAATLEGVDVNGQEVSIENLVAARGTAVPGDSGGLLYRNDEAVGILVARAADNWLFFQPLAEAIAFLEQETGMTLAPFVTAPP